MADLNQVITLGLGTPADIPHFVLVGLSPEGSPPPPPAEGPHARTGDSAWSGGIGSEPAIGGGWTWSWHR